MRVFLVLVGLVLMLPGAASQGGLIFGTEELPELPPSGPPSYAATYTGARDHSYLEILAGWFSYDEASDEIVWTLKTTDGTGYANPPADWAIGCSAGGNVTGGTAGFLRFTWGRAPDTSGSSSVSFTYAAGNQGGIGQTSTDRVDHRFASVLEAPAYFEFRVNRSELLDYGAQVEDFTGQCSEGYAPVGAADLVTGEVTTNSAESSSKAIYSFIDLRRVQGPDGSLDPIEKFERNNTTSQPSSDAPAPSNGTPSAGAVGMLLATVAAAGVAGARFRKPE